MSKYNVLHGFYILVSIEVPPGRHEIKLKFKNSVYRSSGIIVSIISAALILFIFLLRFFSSLPPFYRF